LLLFAVRESDCSRGNSPPDPDSQPDRQWM